MICLKETSPTVQDVIRETLIVVAPICKDSIDQDQYVIEKLVETSIESKSHAVELKINFLSLYAEDFLFFWQFFFHPTKWVGILLMFLGLNLIDHSSYILYVTDCLNKEFKEDCMEMVHMLDL